MSEGALLRGLDGSNPLAFLASLGTLRTLAMALADEQVEMRWEQYDGAWRPRVFCSRPRDGDGLLDVLHGSLSKQLGHPWTIDKRLPFLSCTLRGAFLTVAVSLGPQERKSADVLAAFGTEVVADSKGCFAETSFRMVRSGDSAGQGLLHYACQLAASTTRDDLQQCLMLPWVYSDRGSSFRWDPNEDRMYALQATNPSGDRVLSVAGANRLALEALPTFPVYPTDAGATTVSFIRPSPRAEIEFRWPIWGVPIPFAVAKSLLSHPDVLQPENRQSLLRAAGVEAVFASRQFKPNQYYRNFSPARQL